MRAVRLLAVALLAGTASSPPSGAQSEPADVFSQSVEVRVVNVDVHVTDRKGHPITGLTQDDFDLFVDGRKVEVAYFFATEGRREPAATSEAEALRPDETGPQPRPVSIPQADNLLVVLYLDHNWLAQNDRQRILDDLEQFVAAQATNATRFLVVTSDPGLNVRTPITTNLEAVREALVGLGELPTHGDDIARERRGAFRDIQTTYESYKDTPCAPCDCGWGQMLGIWEAFAQRVTNRMQTTAAGLSDLLAALSGIPDRKAVLYVAGGLEQRPALDVLQFLSELCPVNERDAQTRTLNYDESGPLLKLGALANASRVTFYPLDSGGLRPDSATSIEWENTRFRASGLVSRIERENYQASLQILASETGGTAIFNANHPYERLRQLETDFDYVYSLGYEPPFEADGRSHQLRVELRESRRGADLRFRRAYIDKPLDGRLVDRAVAAITFGEERNPLAVEAGLGAPTTLARNVVSLPVHVAVRPDRLTLVPAADGTPTGRFRVFLAARSPTGARTVLREKFFDVGPEETAESVMRLIVTMSLEPGDYTVAVGVRDEVGLETSYVTLDTTDPDARVPEVEPDAGS